MDDLVSLMNFFMVVTLLLYPFGLNPANTRDLVTLLAHFRFPLVFFLFAIIFSFICLILQFSFDCPGVVLSW